MITGVDVAQLAHSATIFLRDYGYLAAFILLFVEEAGVPLPVPGDGILMFLGHQAATGVLHPVLALAVVVVAATLGASLLYAIARRVGHPLLLRYGRLLHLDSGRLERVETWIQARPGRTIVAGRLIPGFRTATSAVSGSFEVPYQQFLLFTAVACFIWAVFFMVVGAFAGEIARELYGLLAHQPPAAAAVPLLAVALLIAGVLFLRARHGGRGRWHRVLARGEEQA